MDKVKETLQNLADGYIKMGYVAGVIERPDNTIHIYLEDKVGNSEVYVSGIQFNIKDEASMDKFMTAAGRLLRDRRIKLQSYNHLLGDLLDKIADMQSKEDIIGAIAAYRNAIQTEINEKYNDFELKGENDEEE